MEARGVAWLGFQNWDLEIWCVKPQGFYRAAIFSHRVQFSGLPASGPALRGGGSCEEPSQLDAGVDGKGVEISKGDGFAAGDGTSCWGEVGLATHCVVLAFLGAADTFGAGFLLLAFLLVHVTGAFLGASVTSVGVGAGWALATRPPRRTWLQLSPRLHCSADGWSQVDSVRVSPEGAPLLTTGPALASFHFPQPR